MGALATPLLKGLVANAARRATHLRNKTTIRRLVPASLAYRSFPTVLIVKNPQKRGA